MKEALARIILIIICVFTCSVYLCAQTYPGYTLVWSDEFDGGYSNADLNTGLDLNSWNYETGNGNGGWGTGQLDYATTDLQNVEVSQGTLKIRAQRNNPSQTYEYTSGRINSKNKQSFLYGKIEARIRTQNITEPGRGFAFWMMPNGLPAGSSSLMWPQGGEMDIFEYNGLYPAYNLGSVHYAWKWNQNLWGGDANHASVGGIYNPQDRAVAYWGQGRDGCNGPAMTTEKTNLLGAEYHIYGINWYNDRVEFYVDQDIYHTFYINKEIWCGDAKINNLGKRLIETGYDFGKIVNDGTIFTDYFRPFENPFYLILSAGVGGTNTYGGNINNGTNPTTWTATTEIDWVHVYKLTDVNPPMISFSPTQYDVAIGNVTVAPTKLSGDNIAKMEYFVDKWENKATLVGGTSFVWNATDGCHTLYVRACNAAGYWGNWTKVKYSVGTGCGTTLKYDYWVIYRDTITDLAGSVLDCRNAVDNNSNDLVASSTCNPVEGNSSLCYDTKAFSQANWLGRYISSKAVYDLSQLEDYSLHFKVRTNYPYEMKIVIKESDSNEGYYNLSASSGNGYAIDNQWREIEIPVSSFTNLDVSSNHASAFLFGIYPANWNTVNSYSKHIELDDIYFHKRINTGITDNAVVDHIKIFTSGQSVIIENAPVGTSVKLYAINGMMKTSRVISTSGLTIPLSPGFYIICCGSVVEKIIVQ